MSSGKSSCIAIPSLLAWRDSVFAIDIKGELYENTKNQRRNIRVFNPTVPNAWGYNPFHLLDYADENQAQDAETIARALVPMPADVKEPFWIKGAQDMLTAAILHYYNDNKTFIQTLTEILSKSATELVNVIQQSQNINARFYIGGFVGADVKYLSGVFMELRQHITVYVTDKNLYDSLSKLNHSIKPEDLEKGIDIYIQIPEHLLEQWKNLLTLIVKQFLTHFQKRPIATSQTPIPPILFLLDEFARLGKIEGITDALATLRSKKVTICMLLQNLSQLDVTYGEKSRDDIIGTCSYQAVLRVTDLKTQKYFSEKTGTYDREKTTDSINRNILGIKTGTGTSKTTEERKKIKHEEFGIMSGVVLFAQFAPGFFKIDRAPYWEHGANPHQNTPNAGLYGKGVKQFQKRQEKAQKKLQKQQKKRA